MRRYPVFLLVSWSCAAAIAACSATQNLGSDGTNDGGGSGTDDGGGLVESGATSGDGAAKSEGGTAPEAGGEGGGGVTSPGPKLVAGGQGYTCAVAAGGAVKCWGADFYGELGDGRTLNNPVATPTAAKVLTSGVVALSGRFRHTCALTSGGAVYCWGQSSQGATGTSSATTTSRPRRRRPPTRR